MSGTTAAYVWVVSVPEGTMAWLLAAMIVLAGLTGIGGAGYVRACTLLLERSEL